MAPQQRHGFGLAPGAGLGKNLLQVRAHRVGLNAESGGDVERGHAGCEQLGNDRFGGCESVSSFQIGKFRGPTGDGSMHVVSGTGLLSTEPRQHVRDEAPTT